MGLLSVGFKIIITFSLIYLYPVAGIIAQEKRIKNGY